MLFFIKECEFLTVLGFAALVAWRNPVGARRGMEFGCSVLALWTIKELIAPTGLYYLGLPFEQGPSQTGGVYALATVIWLMLLHFNWSSSSSLYKIVFAPSVLALLCIGNLASQSRTGQAAMLTGLAAYILLRVRSWPVLMLLVPIAGIVYQLVFTSESSVFDAAFTNRWNTASDNLPDRVLKWQAMYQFQLDHAPTLIFGAGFSSPNVYVLQRFSTIDLGNVLAVDNGYVRRLFETGIVGSVMYYNLILTLVLRFAARAERAIVVGATASFLTIAFAIESFQVVQIAMLYFITVGMLAGLTASRLSRSGPAKLLARSGPVDSMAALGGVGGAHSLGAAGA